MRTTAFCFLLLILFSQLLLSCSSSKERSADTNDMLDQYFRTVFPEQEPGGAVLIMKDDDVIFSKGYGLANVELKEPITPATLFNLGSVSKTFVANAILKLADENKLSLQDPLSEYFQFRNESIGEAVTIAHLLTHTSGLPDNRNVSADTIFYLSAKDEENWAPVLNADSLRFAPGTRYEYSNPAFNALALIIEKVTGVKWQHYVTESIMRPSGMNTSTITDGPHPESGVAHAYVKLNGEWKEDDYGEEPTFAAAGNGGVWSSVEELAKYELANQRGIFLRKALVEDARTVKKFAQWSASYKPFIGWSWFVEETDGVKTVGHSGDQGGFLCEYVNIPDERIFFVVICNSRRDIKAMRRRITDVLLDRSRQ
jgi:CubicO group peptidase (beta-lactamase class C family)